MRRRVQLGITLEVLGTQVSNFVFHSSWEDYVHAMNTFHFENSALLLGVHCILVWKYHAFLRDALLARHVTRVATTTLDSTEVDGVGDAARVVFVETGPWTRRVELMRPRVLGTMEEVDVVGAQVPFGQLLQLGVLHVDSTRGEVVNATALEHLVRGDLVVGREEVTTDVPALLHVHVSPEKMMPFLADAGVSTSLEKRHESMLGRLGASAWLSRRMQFSGAWAMDAYGYLAIAMGLGTVLLWMVPRS